MNVINKQNHKIRKKCSFGIFGPKLPNLFSGFFRLSQNEEVIFQNVVGHFPRLRTFFCNFCNFKNYYFFAERYNFLIYFFLE